MIALFGDCWAAGGLVDGPAAIDKGAYTLEHLSELQFRRAWHLRQKYQDKPDISFVDFTSMVVLQDLGIVDIFMGDDHFRQVNLGFRLHP